VKDAITGLSQTCNTLIAGQNTNVGKVCVSTSGVNGAATTPQEYLNLCYTLTASGWYFSSVHAWSNKTLNYPTSGSSVAPLQFPTQVNGIAGFYNSLCVQIPLCASGGIDAQCCGEKKYSDTVFYLISQASVFQYDSTGKTVLQNQTAYGNGTSVTGGSYTSYSLTCNC
jgi:hypothetical protein